MYDSSFTDLPTYSLLSNFMRHVLQLQLLYITKSQHNGMKTLSIFACSFFRHRAGSEQETVIRNPPRNRGYFSGPPRAFCIEKYNISRSGYHSKFHRILRLPRKVTLQLHRILRLPRKMTRIIDPHDMSHVIYNAQRNSTHPPTSLNTAPATQNETHD